MQRFEAAYADIISSALLLGESRSTRNATTRAIFGQVLKIDMRNNFFPILQGRKMYPKGVKGELAAMLRKPKHVEDFKKWGCNYWDLWAAADGSLKLDYGNAWFDFNGVDQVAQLKDKLANNPTDRAMIITGWKPDGMHELSLRCCHHTYQFFVSQGRLSMAWSQRSVDLMVGLPSDIIFAAAMLIAVAREFNLKPGEITMFLGDCHVYEQHIEAAHKYVRNVATGLDKFKPPTYIYNKAPGEDFCTFEPDQLVISPFETLPKIDLELIA